MSYCGYLVTDASGLHTPETAHLLSFGPTPTLLCCCPCRAATTLAEAQARLDGAIRSAAHRPWTENRPGASVCRAVLRLDNFVSPRAVRSWPLAPHGGQGALPPRGPNPQLLKGWGGHGPRGSMSLLGVSDPLRSLLLRMVPFSTQLWPRHPRVDSWVCPTGRQGSPNQTHPRLCPPRYGWDTSWILSTLTPATGAGLPAASQARQLLGGQEGPQS